MVAMPTSYYKRLHTHISWLECEYYGSKNAIEAYSLQLDLLVVMCKTPCFIYFRYLWWRKLDRKLDKGICWINYP